MNRAFVRALASVASRAFYRVESVGVPPAAGAVILLPNHANALLDPALVWATSGRSVRFLAKSTLFDGALRFLVKGSGAIPVYRRADQGADVSKNTETFAAVEIALAAGDAVCLFPEGISHSSGRLVGLRTGAARMAIGATRAGVEVRLVAVGLNFERKTRFRSRATIVYGHPFACGDLADERTHPDGVRELTERIAERMRQLLVEADPKGDAGLVDRVDRIYAAARSRPNDLRERVDRRRVIAAGIERLRALDPERYGELLLRLRRYDERLRRFGLRDRHLDWTVSRSEAARFAIREGLAAAALLPFAAAAAVIFALPYQLTGYAARWFTREPDVAATAKVVGGFLIYAAWAMAMAGGVWWIEGARAGLLALLALPLLAVAGLAAIERESAVLEMTRAWLMLARTNPNTRERLRRRRSELADILDEVNAWLAESAEPVTRR